MSKLVATVLAAGKGTRMKSRQPKVLHEVGGVPMVSHVLQTAKAAGADDAVVIVGFGGDKVAERLGSAYHYVEQAEQLGTGHALMLAQAALQDADTVLVICGDTPLLRAETLRELIATHTRQQAAATILTTTFAHPTGYGRIIRDAAQNVRKIVEEKDASPAEKKVTEVNTGTYCFDARKLWPQLQRITNDNAQGEYYLTDVIDLLVSAGETVTAATCADSDETLGVNSRAQLAQAEAILRQRKNEELMAQGVTLIDPARTYVDADVRVGQDTILEPGTILRRGTVVGSGCHIGPDTELDRTTVGDNSHLHRTYAHEASVGSGCEIGPYVHLRPHTQIADHVKVGNFVEVKNSTVGEGTKLPHLSYLGDSDIGGGVNIGCGTITVNYDGHKKYRTTIEDGAFVGCNSNLVAPVVIGRNAYIGAGSTITKDVPAKALAVARARQFVKEDWVKQAKETK